MSKTHIFFPSSHVRSPLKFMTVNVYIFLIENKIKDRRFPLAILTLLYLDRAFFGSFQTGWGIQHPLRNV